jgi:hypothetical protein
MRITIDGIARRADPAELVVPDQVPVTVGFDARRPIGLASCRRHKDGAITVEAEIHPESVIGEGPDAAKSLQRLNPFLGIQAVYLGGLDRPGILTQIALIGRNADPELPPYRMTLEMDQPT